MKLSTRGRVGVSVCELTVRDDIRDKKTEQWSISKRMEETKEEEKQMN